jgi:hypothetical protein
MYLKSNLQKKIEGHLEGHWRKEQDPTPDPEPYPLVRGTDPRIWIRIRIKMSRIRNTDYGMANTEYKKAS